MNTKNKKIVKQLRELVANPPPHIKNLKWFWSLEDLVKKFVLEEKKKTTKKKVDKPPEEPPKEEDKE